MIEVDRQAEVEPRVAAAAERQRRPPRDALPFAVDPQAVRDPRRQAGARDDALPGVAVGVRRTERHLQPVGAERAQRQLPGPEPRQRRAEDQRVRLPHVFDRHAERDVAADPRREAEVEGVGPGEAPFPDVGPGDAQRGVAQEMERVGELKSRVAVDPAAAGHV